MSETQARLRDAARELFSAGRVDLVIGYEKGTLPMVSRPCFIGNADQAGRLVWDSFCASNLAVYLPRLFERPSNPRQEYRPPTVGIVAKGCDSRSVIGLLKENQIPREKVVIVGVPCTGLADREKADAALHGARIADCVDAGNGTLELTAVSGETRIVNTAEILHQACIECPSPTPQGADVMIEGQSRGAGEKRPRLKEFAQRSREERWQYFVTEIARCVRCYACRQACPNCYCKVCFADQTQPRWVGAGDDLSDLQLYHIGRIFHQAGRCVECDACVRACPMGIDLRLFTQKPAEDVEALFGYMPGSPGDDPPPLCTFDQDDRQDFISEP